jgi:hypothetical protein
MDKYRESSTRRERSFSSFVRARSAQLDRFNSTLAAIPPNPAALTSTLSTGAAGARSSES